MLFPNRRGGDHRKKPSPEMTDDAEERFQKMVDLIRDLDKKNFNKLMVALDLVFRGYDKIRTVQTEEEEMARAEDEEGLGEYMDVK